MPKIQHIVSKVYKIKHKIYSFKTCIYNIFIKPIIVLFQSLPNRCMILRIQHGSEQNKFQDVCYPHLLKDHKVIGVHSYRKFLHSTNLSYENYKNKKYIIFIRICNIISIRRNQKLCRWIHGKVDDKSWVQNCLFIHDWLWLRQVELC